MPDKRFVSELQDNEHVQSVFLVTSKQVRMTRNDDPYLCVTLQDRTGTIEGRGWEDAQMLAERFEVDDFILVRARASPYQGELQLTVDDLQVVPDGEVDVGDFLPTSRWSPDAMFDQLVDLVDTSVHSNDVRRILESLLGDEAIAEAFRRAPAATSNHHAYCGGLLEHCLSMSRIAVRLADHYAHYYPGLINQDLLIAGCVLHDLGKIEELNFQRSFEYSTQGRLIGHITQGVELLSTAVARTEPPPPNDLVDQLKHLVLSHHGKREYGSPVRPRTPEAVVLHQIDMIDSRVNMLFDHLEEHRDGPQGDEDWTGYHRAMERNFFAGPTDPPEWTRDDTPDPDELLGPGAVLQPEDGPAGEDAGDSGTAEPESKTVDMFGDP